MSDGYIYPEEIQLNVGVSVAAAELKHFHYQNGGTRLLPQIQIEDNAPADWIVFRVIDGDSEASLAFRPHQNRGSILTVNPNATHLWGWMLGVPGRSELGVSTYLGAETSSRCEDFCNSFVSHLERSGYLVQPSDKTERLEGGRPRDLINEWARNQVHNKGRKDTEEVYREWLSMRKDGGRPPLANPWESFKKAIRLQPKKRV